MREHTENTDTAVHCWQNQTSQQQYRGSQEPGEHSTRCSTLSAFSYFLGKLILLSLHLQLQSLTANSDLVQLITTYAQYGLRHSKRTNFKIRLKEEIWSNSSAVILQMSVRSSSGKHWGSRRGQKVNSRGLKKSNNTTTHFHPAVLQQKKHQAWERKVPSTKHSDLPRDY